MSRVWDDYHWNFWDKENEKLPEKVSKYRKISICTTCMNRLEDLKRTLPKNIEDNKDYPNVEFVLLDYNSADGLSNWIKNNMIDYIESGKLVYYKTIEPKYFRMGHSRNVAFKLSTGEIVNNVDADNFIGKGFVDVINKLAELCPERAVFAKGKRMMHGRIGFYKNEFLTLGGYDEDLVGYGFDDHSLIYRAMALGHKFMWWNELGDFMNRIRTSSKNKTKHMSEANKNWRETEIINKEITMKKMKNGEFIVNKNRNWGKASVTKNFKDRILVS